VSFYEPLGDGRFTATPHTRGPWDPAFQHAGPPAALLGRELERCAPREDFVLARTTFEILRPIPVAEVAVSAQVVRPGRSVELLEGELSANGEVVIGYNRSGSGTDGKIAFMGRVFRTDGNGHLYQASGELMLKESLTNDYHNGSLFGQPAAGRQRWGDYSQVSVDPNDPRKFWLIGEFAREYNLPEFGHPGGTGGSRWSTWIAGINAAAVPEPATWAMMIAGFGMVGFAMRRSQKVKVSFA